MTLDTTSYFEREKNTFEDLTNFVDALLFIDTTSLDQESSKSSQVFVCLYKLLSREGKYLKQVVRVHDELVMARKRYYSGKATAAEYKAEPLNITIMKTEINDHIDIDEKVVKVREYLAEADLRVRFIEDSIKVAKSRTYDIKNAIAWKQLTAS